MYQTIFFDLDGTLTDSGPGITHSVAYALNKWNIKVEDYSVLNAFVGPPLAESFAKYYNYTPEQCEKSIEYYDKIYIGYHKKPLIKLNIRQIINIIRKIRKKVKKFVDMSISEVYDKHNNPKENDFDRN